MLDFFVLIYECLRPVNLPFTVLLGAVALYWLLVVFGLADTDLLDAEGGVDAGLDVGAEGGGDSGGGGGGDAGGGFFRPISSFLALGEVPTTVVHPALFHVAGQPDSEPLFQ
jgi:hypothetical protein